MNKNCIIITKNSAGQVIGEFTPETFRRAGLAKLIDGSFDLSNKFEGVVSMVCYVGADSAKKLHSAAAGHAVAFKPAATFKNGDAAVFEDYDGTSRSVVVIHAGDGGVRVGWKTGRKTIQDRWIDNQDVAARLTLFPDGVKFLAI